MNIPKKTRKTHWRRLLIACLLFISPHLSVQANNIDSLKILAQEGPFPERLGHIINWYQATNELFHEPEIAIIKSAIDWLENQPTKTRKQLLNWSNFQLIYASMSADNENITDVFRAASKVVVLADSIGQGEKSWIMQKGQAYFYLNSVAYLENKPLEALEHLEKAYQCFEKIEHQALMARALRSIGVAQSNLGEHQKAYDTYGRSAKIYQEEEIEKGYLRSIYYQAGELLKMERVEESETMLYELIPRMRELEHPSLNIALTNLGDAQARLGKFEAAEVTLAEALALAKERRVNFTVAETCQVLANLAEQKGNYEKALFFQREQGRYADSIRLQSAEVELREAQAKFDQTENEQKIKELEHKIVEEKQSALLKMLLLALGLIAVGIGVFWYLNQKKKKEIAAATRTLTLNLQAEPLKDSEAIDPILKRFLEIVQKEVANETLSVEKIAENMKMSRVQLFKKIKTATDASPSQIIRQYRLEAGKKLLLENELNISQIAYKVGFASPNSFGRAFKDRFGSSPSQFSSKNKDI